MEGRETFGSDGNLSKELRQKQNGKKEKVEFQPSE